MRPSTTSAIATFATGLFVGLGVGMPTGVLLNTGTDATLPQRPSVTVTHDAAGESFLSPYLRDLGNGPRPAASPSTWRELILPPSVSAPDEDQPGFSCVDDGNRVCGPDNANGAPAGCYDDGGVLFAPWPCTAWTPSDGHHHADGTVTK